MISQKSLKLMFKLGLMLRSLPLYPDCPLLYPILDPSLTLADPGQSDLYRYGSELTLRCVDGYRLDQAEYGDTGHVTAQCLYGGVWDRETFPHCVGQ